MGKAFEKELGDEKIIGALIKNCLVHAKGPLKFNASLLVKDGVHCYVTMSKIFLKQLVYFKFPTIKYDLYMLWV